jgi:[ribosomal protein S18]-alanine N-acetyltransferase
MAARLPQPDDLDVTIGPMRRRHLRAVLRIEQQVYPRPWSMGMFMSELGIRGSRIYLVAVWHRHKLGTRLLHALATSAVQRGAKNLTLEVRTSNHAAQSLYRAFGFAPAGIRKGYYVETKEDAIVMWANDVDTPEYARRLDDLAAAVPGTTTFEVDR